MNKCDLLHLGPLDHYGDYTLYGAAIQPTELVRDLGILVDCQQFHQHTSMVAVKANRILRNLFVAWSLIYIYMYLYKTLVRPILE